MRDAEQRCEEMEKDLRTEGEKKINRKEEREEL